MLLLPLVVLLLAYWTDVGRVDLDGILAVPTTTKDTFASSGLSQWMTAVIESTVLCPSCKESHPIKLSDNAIVNVPLLALGVAGLLAWFVFQVLLERFLPCELVQGNFIQNNPKYGKLTYRINGHLAFWVTLLVTQAGWPTWHEPSQTIQFGRMPLQTLLYDHYATLALASILLCTMLSTSLYISSFSKTPTGGPKILAVGGNSGVAVYDFFMGRELNPRSGYSNFDWKEFCELRPGLIGWVLLNLACLQQQYETLGYVTGSMLLINLFQGFYVWDAQYQERAILTTMDIATDGFGYMLVFGDMCWVPFTYSAQARYLVKHDPHLSVGTLAAIVVLYMLGFFIFRGANGQKDVFRRNPNDPEVSHLTYLETKRGTKLLTSGWWGMARKINYTGDYIMGLTWCLLCGVDSIVPYYYAIYFVILLIHRSIRDDQMCHEKYGDDWLAYKQRVPYRFVPGII